MGLGDGNSSESSPKAEEIERVLEVQYRGNRGFVQTGGLSNTVRLEDAQSLADEFCV